MLTIRMRDDNDLHRLLWRMYGPRPFVSSWVRCRLVREVRR